MKQFTLQEIETIRLRKYTGSYGIAVTDESFKVCRMLFDIERNEYMKGLSGEEPTKIYNHVDADLDVPDVAEFVIVVHEILTRAYNAGVNKQHYKYWFSRGKRA